MKVFVLTEGDSYGSFKTIVGIFVKREDAEDVLFNRFQAEYDRDPEEWRNTGSWDKGDRLLAAKEARDYETAEDVWFDVTGESLVIHEQEFTAHITNVQWDTRLKKAPYRPYCTCSWWGQRHPTHETAFAECEDHVDHATRRETLREVTSR